MSRLSQAGKRPISERISIFEKQSSFSTSTTNSPSSPLSSRRPDVVGAGNSSSSSSSEVVTSSHVKKTVVSRTFSAKNFDSIKSQFDASGGSRSSGTPPALPATPPPAAIEPPPPEPKRERPAPSPHASPVKPRPQQQPPQQQQHTTVTRTSVKKSPTVPIHSSVKKTASPPSGNPARPASRSATSPIQKPAGSPRRTSPTPPPQKASTPKAVGPSAAGKQSTPVRQPGGAPTARAAGHQTKAVSGKSQTSPVHIGHPGKSPPLRINTVTIDVNKDMDADGDVVVPAGSKSTTVTRVIKEKSTTAPVSVPTVTVTVEPPSPKISTVEEPDPIDTIVKARNLKNSSIIKLTSSAGGNNHSNNNNNNNKVSGGGGHGGNSDDVLNGGEEQRTYWANQALLNDNSQKIKEAMKLDLEYKDEKVSALNKELEELSAGGGANGEEVAALKRQKNDLEVRLKDQEEELDDLAGQVQMLEQAKIKLEMSMAAMKKDHRREVSGKEDELEDARAAAQKKVKVLEQQLEAEHEERLQFVREKHDLETKIMNLQEMTMRSTDDDYVIKLKKDLKRMKALLKDAQVMVERSRNESSNKVVLRQLKNQLEDAEFARVTALKAKQNAELELSDVQQQLDDVIRSKSDVEDKLFRFGREKADMAGQLEDNEEELQDVMKKYKAAVSQLSVDQITISEQGSNITDLEEERNRLKENLAEYAQKIQSLEGDNFATAQHSRLELKIRELETKLDLEHATRGRMESQINRLKEGIDKLNQDCEQLRNKEQSANELVRKLQRQLRDIKEDHATLQQKETEVSGKRSELEKQLEIAEAETVTARNDLKLALKRIEDLQTAMNGEIDSDTDSLNSDADSDSSEESMSTFLEHHRRTTARERDSIARSSMSRQLETMPEEPDSKCLNDSFESSHAADEAISRQQQQQQQRVVQGLGRDDGEEESQA